MCHGWIIKSFVQPVVIWWCHGVRVVKKIVLMHLLGHNLGFILAGGWTGRISHGVREGGHGRYSWRSLVAR